MTSIRVAAILLAARLVRAAEAPDIDARIVEDCSGNPLPSAEMRFHKAGMRELAADLEPIGI